jgi:hypothetical protein
LRAAGCRPNGTAKDSVVGAASCRPSLTDVNFPNYELKIVQKLLDGSLDTRYTVMDGLSGVLSNEGEHTDKTTAKALRHIREYWQDFSRSVL